MSQWDQNAFISDPGVWILIVLIIVFYGLPSLIAQLRNHPYKKPIFLLNLLGGWTGLFWIIALIWSFTSAEGPMRLFRR